jgi:DNA-binding NarL/FixJ family response regulator
MEKPDVLSGREHEVAKMIAQGLRNKDIALEMGISEQTVKNHVHQIFFKTGCQNRVEVAVRYAFECNPGAGI